MLQSKTLFQNLEPNSRVLLSMHKALGSTHNTPSSQKDQAQRHLIVVLATSNASNLGSWVGLIKSQEVQEQSEPHSETPS